MIGTIYIIDCLDNDKLFYVGSTTDTISNRFQNHLYLYEHWCATGKTSTAKISIYPYFDEYGVENFQVQSVWSGKICDLKHLSAYEQLYINKYKAINKKDVLNGMDKGFFHKCKTSTKEYKLMKAKSDKKYRENNVEYHKEKSRKYNEEKGQSEECECGGLVSFKHRSEHLKTKVHLHFINTGTKLEKKPKYYECKCGSKILNSPSHVKKHLNTDLHKVVCNHLKI